MVDALEKSFWQNQVMLAPLAGVSDYPTREIARRYGATLTFTEMISAEALIRHHEGTWEMLPEPSEKGQTWVQLFGFRPESLARAARLVEDHGALGIDINMGCPAKKVVKNGAGSALMRDPGRVKEILQAVRQAIRLPLTVKMRSGWSRPDWERMLELTRMAEESGCQAVILHPRYREQMFSGRADWDLITRLAEHTSLPVAGNGDIRSAGDAWAMLEQTGCAAVMVGRAAMGNPWIFSQIRALLEQGEYLPLPEQQQRLECALEHLRLAVAKYGAARGVPKMRKQLCWYIRGMKGARALRQTLVQIDDFGTLESFLNEKNLYIEENLLSEA